MKNLIIVCIAVLSLLSCNSGIQPAPSNEAAAKGAPSQGNLPAAEQKALQLVATALTGEATGVVSPDGQTMEMTISNSATMEQEADLLPLHSSRAAWVFYKNLETDKPSFGKIVVHSQLSDTTITREYTVQELAIVKSRLPTFETAGKLLVAGDYQGLYDLFDPTIMGAMKVEGVKQYCTQIEPQYGKAISVEFRGFAFNKTSGGKDFLSLAGPVRRQTKDTALDIAVDLSKPEMKGSISAMKFDY
ncbi:MAG: hypothetical protein IT258_18805 [Saprospiraceae bacterium]|nr:hypothetical protein [Saprospiraceae bacterium]